MRKFLGLKRLGLYSGLAAPLVFVFALLLSIANYPQYDFDYLSDLGSDPHSEIIFNSGLIIVGILGAFFGVTMTKIFKGLSRFGAWAFVAGNISLIGLGIFHSRYESEYLLFGFYSAIYEPGHIISAGMFFLFSAISFAIIGKHLEKRTRKGYYVQLAAVLSFLFLLVQSSLTEYVAVFGVLSAGFLIALHLLGK